MNIRFDQAKRDKTLEERGLDFARAEEVFAGQHLTRIDDRQEYGEDRYVTPSLSLPLRISLLINQIRNQEKLLWHYMVTLL